VLSCTYNSSTNIKGNNYDTINAEDSDSNSDDYAINDSGNEQIDDYFNDPIIASYKSASDTLFVSEDCVIFLWPDSTEIAKIKSSYTEEEYMGILEDMIWYSSIAGIKLDSVGINNAYFDKTTLVFTNFNKKSFKYKRKELKGNMILFAMAKEPIIMNAIDFDLDFCQKYFTNKEEEIN
jgi:hypothetical protein